MHKAKLNAAPSPRGALYTVARTPHILLPLQNLLNLPLLEKIVTWYTEQIADSRRGHVMGARPYEVTKTFCESFVYCPRFVYLGQHFYKSPSTCTLSQPALESAL